MTQNSERKLVILIVSLMAALAIVFVGGGTAVALTLDHPKQVQCEQYRENVTKIGGIAVVSLMQVKVEYRHFRGCYASYSGGDFVKVPNELFAYAAEQAGN